MVVSNPLAVHIHSHRYQSMNIYREIRPKKIADQVYEQIQDLIYRGQLKPGEQLLPERELAETLNVSRNSVREAINKLIDRKLIENRQGMGTFVRKPEPGQQDNPLSTVLGDDISAQELLEFRLGLECNAAVLAARKATSEDIVHLNAVMEEMHQMVKEGSMGHEEDVRFHMGIAYATKNRVQIHMMKRFYDLLYYGIWKSHMYLYQEKPNLEAILNQHGKLVEAIRNHDTQMAYDVMREHIKFVMEFLAVRAE
jgi:GntR family transcriptional regulator, transcriptional repressor for pyruvate dehydrogenase complex